MGTELEDAPSRERPSRPTERRVAAGAPLPRWSRGRWVWLAGGGLAVLAIGLAVQAGLVGQPYAALGVADPGQLARTCAALFRLLATVSATVCVGALVFATFLTRPQPSGVASPAGYAARRTAARAGAVWLAAALVLAPVDAADKAGLPLSRALRPDAFLVLVDALGAPRAWLVTAGCAAVVAVGAARALQWRTHAALLVVAVIGLLPPLTVGSSASQDGHDLATLALMIHVVAAAVWVGTLLAVLRARGGRGEEAWRRYRRLAAVCAVLVAASGLLDAGILAPGTTAMTSGYGAVVLAKVAVLATLGLLLVRLSGRVGRPVTGSGSVLRLVAAELILLLVAYGLSVALTRLSAPKFLLRQPTGHETLLGYELTDAPTALVLLGQWRFHVLFAPVAVALGVGYLVAVRRLRRTGIRWPLGRSLAWSLGCLALLVVSSSGLGRYAPAMFSLQTISHMLLGMLVPLLLVLGAPFTLVVAALPAAADGRLPGLREWAEALRTGIVARLLTHPLAGTVVFAGAPFLLYFTDLFGFSIRYHWAHTAVHTVFLVIGFGFAWLVAGVDPLPRTTPGLFRLGALMAAMPLCVAFAAAILNSGDLIGNGAASGNLYTGLDLPWVRDLAADQRLGGYLALAIGETCMLLLLAMLLWRWGRHGARGQAELMGMDLDADPLGDALPRVGSPHSG
ncbi:cytochrome c oxidase assembly protein [Micromonospora sp. WMMD975]|uniref:cytochrome c oxidase assembly protein n=1 Tax=Micromonospora sp. WMMD975 TaxID=3016087 RepID=UPI00249BE90C|nr:cytochrome c oxidase assembly protein [Micromonospora sp. WMMD975]WFE30933.1 cytochrome c oxidase assembly protein [Micromonospora sp. WMMD975]